MALLKKADLNILFICSRNKWRSKTAEDIYKRNTYHRFKSAGTEPSANVKISEKMLHWADLIFVMEQKHKQRIYEKYRIIVVQKEVVVLNIQDSYEYMDSELIELIQSSVDPYL